MSPRFERRSGGPSREGGSGGPDRSRDGRSSGGRPTSRRPSSSRNSSSGRPLNRRFDSDRTPYGKRETNAPVRVGGERARPQRPSTRSSGETSYDRRERRNDRSGNAPSPRGTSPRGTSPRNADRSVQGRFRERSDRFGDRRHSGDERRQQPQRSRFAPGPTSHSASERPQGEAVDAAPEGDPRSPNIPGGPR